MPPLNKPTVTAAEGDVLDVLWEQSPLSAREIFDRLPPERAGKPQTVRTLLDRLLVKGVVRRRDAHGVWVFAPRRTRAEVAREAGRQFLRRFFAGRAELGAAYFIEHETPPPEELRRLRKLLDDKIENAAD